MAANVDAALSRIASASGARVDPRTLVPVEVILELSGEAVRSRLCTFNDVNGNEHCLRPDLTTPIAQLVASGDLPVGRYYASGPVYRLPARGSNDPVEHQQLGFEWFAIESSISEDAEALAVALEAANVGGADARALRFGDVAIYHAVIEALPFTPPWKERLRRAFSRKKGPRELLESAAGGKAGASGPASDIGKLPPKEAVRAVEQMLASIGVEPAGRSVEEIAERLRDKAAERMPDPAAAEALKQYLGLSASAAGSVAAIDAFAREAGVNLGAALEAYSCRQELIEKLNPPFWSVARFSAEAGRRFEYYDGFVFELALDPSFERPVVSGGRYDRLITRLSGGSRDAKAIGAGLRVDRLGSAA